MENEWGTLRLATRHFTEASRQIAEFIAASPHLREKRMEDPSFSDSVWNFIEDLLACRFLVCRQKNNPYPSPQAIIDEFRGMLEPTNHNVMPWKLSEIALELGNRHVDVIQECAAMLEKVPCNPMQVWVFGSLHEYRMGLLFYPLMKEGGTQIKLVKNPHKKRQAIYYTPRDVVEFILQHALYSLLAKIESKIKNEFKEKALSEFFHLSILDPSCGGGAFLLPAWQTLLNFFDKYLQNESYPALAHPLLVGIDIDLPAVQVARFSLWFSTPPNHPLVNAWSVQEGNALWPGESTIIPKFSFSEKFPSIYANGEDGGFSCVIGNPPYAAIPPIWPESDITRRFQTTASKDLYTLFLEQMVYLGNPRLGRGGMIVPLSLTFSKDMISTRDFIRASGRHWKISSYHIRPSGIFPGVSQRTSIALVQPSEDGRTHIETTCVQRWSAEQRAELFTRLKYADVTRCTEIIAKQRRPLGIPNIGDPQLSNLLLKLLVRGEKIGDALISPKKSPHDTTVLYYFTMAYHWLSVSTQLPDLRGIDKPVALSSLIPLYFSNEADRWTALALIASSLGFWWWQIFGDLFHVTQGLLSQFPVNPAKVDVPIKEKLIILAKDLQVEIDKNVTFFTKKGVTNANFDLTRCFQKILPIDLVLMQYLNISCDEWKALYANYVQTTGKNIK